MKTVSTPPSVPASGPQRRTDAPTTERAGAVTKSPVDVIDFSDGINNPIEALVMPLADQVAAMIASNQFDSNATVQVAVGDQRISYTLSKPVDPRFVVPGEINGQPFELNASLDPRSMAVSFEGRPADSRYEATLAAGLGAFGTSGTIGNIAFEQNTELDVFNARIDIDGKVAGEDYTMRIGTDEEGRTVGLGRLGERAISLRVEAGPNGSILVHQDIGDVHVEEIISPT